MNDFKKNYLIFLVIAGCFVAIIGFFSYTKFYESRVRGAAVEKSRENLKDISQLRSQVFQAINENKEFRITGSTADLEKYNLTKRASVELVSTILVDTRYHSLQNRQAKEIQRELISLHDAILEPGKKKGNARSLADNKNIEALQHKVIQDIDAFIRIEGGIFHRELDNLIGLNRSFYIAVVIGAFAVFALLMYMNYYLLLAQHREASIQKKFEELKEIQAQSFQATKDGFFEWKLQEQGIYWSPRLKEMVGYEDAELKASPEMLEQLMHPEDREAFWQHLHKHLRGENSEHSTFFRWQHKDGNWIWIHSRGRAIFNEFGDPVKLIGVHTDVTKIKEDEFQLAKSKDEAEKANNAKSDFLAHMSHEIRTPLTAITGVAEILTMQKARFDEKTQRLLSALNASAISLRDLISDILDFSKIESGKVVLEKKEINLGEFFENLVSIISVKAAEKKLVFECDYQSVSGLSIVGDPTRLRQILINLVGNAIKFTNKGSVKITAGALVANQSEFLRIEVVDTGIGIPEDQLPYIFDSFQQADASISRKYGGTGLGLPIARHLAQLMQGNIYAQSQAGEGSAFTLHIPLTRSTEIHAEEIKKEIANQKLPLGEQDKILIVEDYEGNIAFITHILDELGVKYDLGRTGLEGLKLWGNAKYKLILMDIQMPEMDGVSAVKHIRRIEKENETSPIPIIAMTAHAFSEDRDKCLKAGFNEYLAKPLSKHALFEKMSELLTKQTA